VSPSASPSGATDGPAGDPFSTVPAPDERIPRDVRVLSGRLAAELAALDVAIEAWRRDGDLGVWPPPSEVELRMLFVQRAIRTLGRDPRLARRTIAWLPRAWRFEVRANVSATAALFRHGRPVESADGFRTAPPRPAGILLEWFGEAEARFGVHAETLAAVMLIETRFGRIVSRSTAGATGPMQFIPSTWEAYGMGGDVHDPHDAILGAANYLRASGAPRAEGRALYAYNPLDSYVHAVSSYADVMRRDPDAFLRYYNWQVFVRTVGGDVQLTGPGAERR
jgi:soluble lytic murein transglycosylase-like protein